MVPLFVPKLFQGLVMFLSFPFVSFLYFYFLRNALDLQFLPVAMFRVKRVGSWAESLRQRWMLEVAWMDSAAQLRYPI